MELLSIGVKLTVRFIATTSDNHITALHVIGVFFVVVVFVVKVFIRYKRDNHTTARPSYISGDVICG